jgi:hypothetical protein
MVVQDRYPQPLGPLHKRRNGGDLVSVASKLQGQAGDERALARQVRTHDPDGQRPLGGPGHHRVHPSAFLKSGSASPDTGMAVVFTGSLLHRDVGTITMGPWPATMPEGGK